MELLDRLRRLYPPYYDFNNGTFVTARVGDELEWLGSDGKPLPGQNAKRGDVEKHIDFVKETPTSPLDPHWAWLLDPLEPIGNASAKGIAFEQLGDDRMPGMAYVAVNKPRRITRGDFVRLAFFDDPGDPNAFPNAPGFHDNFEAEHCYDRYWHPVNDGKHNWCATRYMLCDYAFSLVGDANNRDFFTNAQSGALAHFRHHYATMGLLLHYQKTALLTFYDRLAGAVAKRGKPDPVQIEELHRDFLQFTQRYWFEDLTNQMQGREILDQWRRHMKLPELYQQVREAVTGVNQFLDTREESALSRRTFYLTVIATLGLALSLAIGFFGMEDLDFKYATRWTDLEFISEPFRSLTLTTVLIVFVLFFFGMLPTAIRWLTRAWALRKKKGLAYHG